MTYQAIILVLSSDDECLDNSTWSSPRIYPEWKPMFPYFKRIWESYHTTNPDIKIVYVYGNSKIERKPYDLVFEHVEENNYPGMITKTLLAMKLIDRTYDYNYLIRTNLSTFWNLPLLLDRLKTLPEKECLAGTVITKDVVEAMLGKNAGKVFVPESYIAGYDMIMSRDVVREILPFQQNIINQRVVLNMEDLSLCLGIEKYLGIKHQPRHIRHEVANMFMSNTFMESYFNKIYNESIFLQQDHYRAKNRLNRNVDKIILSRLLEKVYNIYEK